MRDDGERLRDILEAIEKVQKYAARGRERYSVTVMFPLLVPVAASIVLALCSLLE